MLVKMLLKHHMWAIWVRSNITINFIDVGQGDSSLITTQSKKKIIIDGGGSEFATFDVGKQTLLPYFLNKSIYLFWRIYRRDSKGDYFGVMLYSSYFYRLWAFKGIFSTNKICIMFVEKK